MSELSQKQELEAEIFDAKNRISAAKKERLGYFIATSLFCIALVIHYSQFYTFNGWLVGTLWFLAVGGFLATLGSESSKERNLYERLVFKKELLFGVVKSENASDSHFDSLVNINIENLAEYYRLVKIHTQKSFNASLSVAVFGFLLIAVGLVTAFRAKEFENLAYISTASGIIIEFISASFFYLYSKTVQQLKGYHDSLIDVQNMLLSFRLIDTTEDKESKVKLVEKMMEYLSSKK